MFNRIIAILIVSILSFPVFAGKATDECFEHPQSNQKGTKQNGYDPVASSQKAVNETSDADALKGCWTFSLFVGPKEMYEECTCEVAVDELCEFGDEGELKVKGGANKAWCEVFRPFAT